MLTLDRISFGRRRGSVLLTTLLVVVCIVTLLGAILPMTLSGYGLSRADRDRSAALAAAEAGLNWEIARIDNRKWDKDDSGNTSVDGSGNPTLDYWPTETGSAPITTGSRTLVTDSSGNWSQRFVVGTSVNPYSVGSTGTFTIISEGQVKAADGHIIKRRVKAGGGGLFSLFDSAAIFSFSTAGVSASPPSWSIGGSSTVTGGCGSNGGISGNGGPTITVGPLTLWGSAAAVSGVTITGVTVSTRPAKFSTDTADQAANLLMNGTYSGSGVAGWRPTGYNADKTATGPNDKWGNTVNSQAEIVTNDPSNPSNDGHLISTVYAEDFLDGNGANAQPVLDHSLFSGFGTSKRLRLKPGVYYFARISLQNGDTVEIANDWYKVNGSSRTALWDSNHTAINGSATADDYSSDVNRITIFVDAISGNGNGNNPYADSSIGSGLYTALQGDKSTSNALRYRRPGNFRIYAKNTGDFTVSGSSSSPVEFNANVLHYNTDSSGSYYGNVILNSGCHLYGGLFAWTINISGGTNVQQYGSGVFGSSDPVLVTPNGSGGGSSSGSGSGLGSTYGGWLWQEITAS
jgi:Tfp pilus assembly protein PilX